jgi:DNA modification methylase
MEQAPLPGIGTRNQLYCGDCLNVVDIIPDESIDLIYIDPPFYSQRSYEVIWGEEAERFAFEDRWQGGINHYLNYLLARIRKMRPKLKGNGSFYIHLDWHICHYMKVELDKIFGYGNFQNELIWHYQTGGASKSRYSRKHDNIFWYTKSDTWKFHGERIAIPRTEKSLRRAQNPLGARIAADDITKNPNDVLIIQQMNPMARERLGYPTQKPLALLEVIVAAGSDPGDTVLDAFCGCGTTLEAAEKLRRRWIGIDISQSAIRVVEKRLRKMGCTNFDVHGLVSSLKQLQELEPFEFQTWAINAVYGVHSPRKIADMGIDGFTFMEHHPIQVKRMDHVGRPIIDNFVGVLQREKEKRGLIIAFSFSSGAVDEVARLERQDKIKIELIKCADLVAGNTPFKVMV